MIVLDTNVVAELMRPAPAPVVLSWLRRRANDDVVTTAITAAEVRYGIARLPDGRRRDLTRAAEEVFGTFPEQVLPFDLAAAAAYADLVAHRERGGTRTTASTARSPPSAGSTAHCWPPGTSRTSTTPALPPRTPGQITPRRDAVPNRILGSARRSQHRLGEGAGRPWRAVDVGRAAWKLWRRMSNGRRDRQAGASQGPLRLSMACTRRWTLRKQHLTSGGEGAEVATVAGDLVGLHATDPLTPYLSLFARVPGFAAESLDSALYETHDVVRVPAMRNTVFVVARSQLSTVLAATRAAGVRSSWRFFADRLTREQYERAVPQIIGALRGRELTVRELKGSLRLDCDVSAAVKLLCDEAVLVRAHPVGDRRASQYAYALMSDWLPDVDAGVEGDEDEALTRLVRAYLHTYGPVDQADIAWWTGATKRRVRAALAALSGEVSVVTVDGREPEMLMLGVDLAELRAAGVLEPAGLTLLPPLDPYTQGYADRGRFLDVAHAPWVVDRKGNVTSTVLLDGRVVGVWELAERPVAEVRLHLFAPIGAEQVRELRTLAERVACFVLGVPAPVVEYRTMLALTERAGWVRSPLRGASDARPLAAGAPRDGGHGSRSVR